MVVFQLSGFYCIPRLGQVPAGSCQKPSRSEHQVLDHEATQASEIPQRTGTNITTTMGSYMWGCDNQGSWLVLSTPLVGTWTLQVTVCKPETSGNSETSHVRHMGSWGRCPGKGVLDWTASFESRLAIRLWCYNPRFRTALAATLGALITTPILWLPQVHLNRPYQ